MINFEDFQKTDLIVAKILAVNDIEGADKLYQLTLDDGSNQSRTICAGIKEYYEKEELEGRSIVIVANLEPREIRGVESRGMLLAGKDEENQLLSIISPDKEIPPGTKIS